MNEHDGRFGKPELRGKFAKKSAYGGILVWDGSAYKRTNAEVSRY
jgi:hypothetical protein